MSKMTLFVAAMSAFFALSAGQMAAAHDGIRVDDPYVRVARANSDSAAVFMSILNHAMDDDRLLSVRTDAAKRAELHTNSMDANGVMRMEKVEDGFPIVGMAAHALDRGGDHIMLFGLTKPLADGDEVTLTLTFQIAGDVVVKAVVDNARKAGEAMQMEHEMPATD